MEIKKDLIRYYLLVFLPFLFVWAILRGVGVFWYNQLLFSLAFFWPITLNAPGVQERVSSSKYKYSLLRFIFLFDHLFKKLAEFFKLNLIKKMISAFAPILFGGSLVLLSDFGDVPFIFMGVLMAEFILEIRTQFINRNSH